MVVIGRVPADLDRTTSSPYLGDVVPTGTPDADGNAVGLSHPQALVLIDLYLERALRAAIRPRISRSRSPSRAA